MSWLAGLHLLFRRTDGVLPPIGSFLPIGLDVPDAMPRTEVRGDREIALVFDQGAGVAPGTGDWRLATAGGMGVTFAIEYADARNNVTTRRITLRELYRSDDGALYLHSFCHERQALRSFRFDRVQSVIDLDGVVHAPQQFFESELRFPVDHRAACRVGHSALLRATGCGCWPRSAAPTGSCTIPKLA
jgi:WYL domain